MGGSGKTTLDKELYNGNFSSFKRCSFVFDVRDATSRNFLCEKKKKLLADLGVHHFPFDNGDEGKVVLANRLSAHQAFPGFVRISGSVICVEAIINSLEFPDLAVTEAERPSDLDKIPYVRGSEARMLCYVEENEEERRVINICYSEGEFGPYFPWTKAKVVWGKRGRVEEAFYQRKS
ncbi:hypothetical protein SUGI_0144590 [Cryptomeria japonica]|nr:hypothetical protein SUGI_0144590 [Cryptomeria japonica]